MSTAVHFQHWLKKNKNIFSTNLGQFQMEHLQRLKYVYVFFIFNIVFISKSSSKLIIKQKVNLQYLQNSF